MLRRIGLFSRFDRSSASGPHGYQSTGLFACWRRYGLVSLARRLGIVRWVQPRQFVEQRRIGVRLRALTPPYSHANYTALPRTKSRAPSRSPAAHPPAKTAERIPVWRRLPLLAVA